jgi:large subunit ribosomal protein L25
MAIDFELVAEPRQEQGKGASRRLRHAGKVPAIIYGGGKDPQSITLDHNALLRHLEHEAFYSHLLTVKVGGEESRAVLRDLHRHPSKPRILHLDLQRVSPMEKIRMRVPLHFTGADIAPGVKQGGGIVSHLMNDLEIVCLGKDLPEYITVDLTETELNETIHLADLKLPQGVALGHGADRKRPVASIHLPRVIVEPEVVAAPTEVEATAQAAAAPEAGAKPAAGAKEKDAK